MDRRGARVVIELGVVCMAAGLILATWVRRPWQLYLTLGALTGSGGVCLGYTGHALFLPKWFARRRGNARRDKKGPAHAPGRGSQRGGAAYLPGVTFAR